MAKILDIITSPNPNLKKRSDEIKDPTAPEVQNLIPDLVLTMVQKDGIGIAAPQVGINIRLTIINTADGPLALINPEITFKSKKMELGEEGCLSVPGIFGLVRRHAKIKVKARTYSGDKVEFSAQDLFARVIQHEIDHLDGILFIDKAEKIIQSRGAKPI